MSTKNQLTNKLWVQKDTSEGFCIPNPKNKVTSEECAIPHLKNKITQLSDNVCVNGIYYKIKI